MAIDALSTWAQLQIIEPPISSCADWDALQCDVFRKTYLVLCSMNGERSWHLKFTEGNREGRRTVDFLRIDAVGSDAENVCVTLRAALPWTLRYEAWQPLSRYRESAPAFTPNQVVDDLMLAQEWSIGWAKYMAQKSVTASNIRLLHPQIYAFLRNGALELFKDALSAAKFPDAATFGDGVYQRMVAMKFFDDPNAPKGTVEWARRHLRANTVFCVDGCPGFGR